MLCFSHWSENMGKGRLEAFSDGVIAVIITIMVLELKPPHGASLDELWLLLPKFLAYVLSFMFVGIYWVNHHHFFHAIKKVSGGLLWANNFLLFWLSLIPFTTAWMGESHLATWPVVLYAINLLACAIAYTISARVAVQLEGPDSAIANALGSDKKGKLSLVLYIVAIPLAFFSTILACALFLTVSLIWLVPDRRIEKAIR
jgi:uncharacterized membrane protein